ITLFLLLASISTAKYMNRMNTYNILMTVLWLLCASFFHGAMILFLIGIPVYILIANKRINIIYKTLIVMLFLSIATFLLDYFQFGKLKEIQETGISPEYMADRLSTIRE